MPTNSKITIHDVFDLTSGVRDDIKEIKGSMEQYGKRITTLEIWRAEIVGKLAVVSAAFSLAFYAIIDYIKKKLNV